LDSTVFIYIYLRSLFLPLSNLTLLLLVLWYLYTYQNFQALANFNSVFVLWISRLTLHNLGRLLISQMSLLSITNLLIFLAKPKLKFFALYYYDLKINLEENAQSLVSPIYSLLASKQEALKKFIKKNLNLTNLILHSVLVLYIKKNYGSLCLCINFCSLNCITKKDQYPLSLITNLKP